MKRLTLTSPGESRPGIVRLAIVLELAEMPAFGLLRAKKRSSKASSDYDSRT